MDCSCLLMWISCTTADVFILSLVILLHSGEVFTFGNNNHGQLGQGHTKPWCVCLSVCVHAYAYVTLCVHCTCVCVYTVFMCTCACMIYTYLFACMCVCLALFAYIIQLTYHYSGEPSKVDLPGPASQIACGDNHTVVLLASGEIYTFGKHKVRN